MGFLMAAEIVETGLASEKKPTDRYSKLVKGFIEHAIVL